METYQQKWQKQNKQKVLAYNRKDYKKHRPERLKAKKAYCLKNKLKIKEKRKDRYWVRKEIIFKEFENKCKHCGNSDIRVLQIDHINGGGRKEMMSFRFNGFLNHCYKQLLENKISFLKKYQLLCANCNWIKRIENKESC
jgi:hypothetical protein